MCGFLLLILLLGAGCGQTQVDYSGATQIFYVNNTETKVVGEEYAIQSEGVEAQLNELMNALAKLPEKVSMKAPLSMGFHVLGTKYEDGRFTIDVDEKYKELQGTTEVLVRAAIVRTLCQIPEVNFVQITVEGAQLFDAVGELVGWMNKDQFIQNDGNEINTFELTRVKLYFANETGDAIIGAYREKRYSTNTPLEKFVVEELIAGPSGQISGLYPTINSSTKIINIMTKDGICYVNLDENFLAVTGNVSTEVAVYSIVDSLVELTNINKVQILINGEVPEKFGNKPFERNLDIVTTL